MSFVAVWRFGAISWAPSRVHTNLEIPIFVTVAVAHVSVQSACVEETFRAARELASTEQRRNEVV